MLNCHKLQGEFTKPITVDTNDAAHPQVVLTCKGKILEAVKVTPTLVNFGRVNIGAKDLTQTVKIRRGDAGPIKPEVGEINQPGIAAEVREVTPGDEYDLVVKAELTPGSQRLQGRIQLRTGVAEQETVDVNVFGTVMPRVSVRPPTIVIPSGADDNWKQAVEFDWPANTGGFKLTEASINNANLEVTLDKESAKPRVLLKLVHAIEGNLPASTMLTVKTDDPKAAELNVPVRYRAAPGVRRPVIRPQTGAARSGPARPKPGQPPMRSTDGGAAASTPSPQPSAAPETPATPTPE